LPVTDYLAVINKFPLISFNGLAGD